MNCNLTQRPPHTEVYIQLKQIISQIKIRQEAYLNLIKNLHSENQALKNILHKNGLQSQIIARQAIPLPSHSLLNNERLIYEKAQSAAEQKNRNKYNHKQYESIEISKDSELVQCSFHQNFLSSTQKEQKIIKQNNIIKLGNHKNQSPFAKTSPLFNHASIHLPNQNYLQPYQKMISSPRPTPNFHNTQQFPSFSKFPPKNTINKTLSNPILCVQQRKSPIQTLISPTKHQPLYTEISTKPNQIPMRRDCSNQNIRIGMTQNLTNFKNTNLNNIQEIQKINNTQIKMINENKNRGGNERFNNEQLNRSDYEKQNKLNNEFNIEIIEETKRVKRQHLSAEEYLKDSENMKDPNEKDESKKQQLGSSNTVQIKDIENNKQKWHYDGQISRSSQNPSQESLNRKKPKITNQMYL